MGGCACVVNKNKVVVESNLVKEKGKDGKERQKNYFYKISFNSWALIVDFLKYREVREIGKVNRSINTISRSHNILMKFYQNKKGVVSVDTGQLFAKFRKTINMEESEIKPEAEKLYLKENNITKKKEIFKPAYNTKCSKISKTINLDKISVGSFEELQHQTGKKPHKLDNAKTSTLMSRYTVKFKGTIADKPTDNKPKIYYDDYAHTKTSLKITKSLKDNCSDNMTPSFKDSEINPDFISNIGDLISKKNVIPEMNNNFTNVLRTKKKSQEFILNGGYEKEFNTNEDLSLHTIGNEDKSYQDAKSFDRNLGRMKITQITPSTCLNSFEHPHNQRSIVSSALSPKKIN